MTPFAPKFTTIHSLLSGWARCQRVDIKAKDLRGNQASVLSHDLSLGSQVKVLVRSVFDGFYTPERLIDEHTQVPLYASVMHESQALAWRERLIAGCKPRDTTERGIRGLGLVESQILRRCPTCMAEDRSLYGCAHWRLFHQWPVVRHCALHGDLLQSKCARCHMPFVRGNQARLADDVCPHCHSINGAADPFIPPAGYWPLVRLMFSTLTGHAPSLATIHRSIAALDIQPGRIGLGADTTRAQRMARRTCHAWNVGSVYELAAALGVNWIWSNETERSASLREWPPMVKLALAANDEPYRYELKSANDEPIRLPLAA